MTTELDRAFAAVTRNARMSGVVIGDRLDPLYAIHKALNAKHADGELTDEQYTKRARELYGDARQVRKCAVPQNYGLNSQDRAGAAGL